MDARAVSTAFALRGAVAALRPPGDAPPARPTARPPVGLGGLLPDLTSELTRAAALEGPKVEANRRVYLPRCLEVLGWEQGRQVRLEVRGHVAVVTGEATGRGKPVTVNANRRLVLPSASLGPLGAEPGQCLVALVPDGRPHLVLVGPAAAQSISDLLALPPHVRDLVGRLGTGCSTTRAAALGRLVDKLDDAGLAALASVSVERLIELGLVPAQREVA